MYLLVSLSILAAPADNSAAIQKPPKLEGAWTMVSMENHDGTKLPDEILKSASMKFSNGVMTIQFGGKSFEAKYVLKPNLKPMGMDVTPQEGPMKGKTSKAIFKVEGDQLTIAGTKAGNERPKEFKTDEKLEVSVMVLKRKK